jgi:hypothetical protein
MRVACLGWGSLLWDPRTLPMADSFRPEGPRLPIEFSRVSTDGRVTLVIDPGASEIETYCVRMDVASLGQAIEALGVREKVAPARVRDWIGSQARDASGGAGGGECEPVVRARIAEWLAASSFDAVVWTALPPRTPAGDLELPSLEVLIEHLRSLEGSALERAEQYIRRAPAKVRTPHRARFEAVFGWSPIT